MQCEFRVEELLLTTYYILEYLLYVESASKIPLSSCKKNILRQ